IGDHCAANSAVSEEAFGFRKILVEVHAHRPFSSFVICLLNVPAMLTEPHNSFWVLQNEAIEHEVVRELSVYRRSGAKRNLVRPYVQCEPAPSIGLRKNA